TGDEFFAGAALAGDQDDDVLGSDAADGLVNLPHGWAAADDGVAAVLVGGCFRDHGWLAHHPPELQGLANDVAQASKVKRFEEVVVSALFHRLDSRVGGRGPGNEDNRNAAVDLTDPLINVQSRQVREMHVEEDDVGQLGRDLPESILGRPGDFDPN